MVLTIYCLYTGGVFLAITTHYTNEGSGFVVPSACAKSGGSWFLWQDYYFFSIFNTQMYVFFYFLNESGLLQRQTYVHCSLNAMLKWNHNLIQNTNMLRWRWVSQSEMYRHNQVQEKLWMFLQTPNENLKITIFWIVSFNVEKHLVKGWD